jgi:hypothetical protein
MLTKDILFGMNILTLAGLIVVGITLPRDRLVGLAPAVRSVPGAVAYRTVVRWLQRQDAWRRCGAR